VHSLKRILIVGATSSIAEAVAREFARRGDALLLVARDEKRLQATAADLKMRGAARIETFVLDARQMDAYPSLLEAAFQQLHGLDVALIAYGTLSDQKACELTPGMLTDEFMLNAVSIMELCLALALRFEQQRRGVLAVISSVAGDRGRRSNYVYGAAKAALSTFSSGLRQRLRRSGVAVVTIKPGFVDTAMTADFRKNALWASPAAVAHDIVRAIDRGTPVLYTPWFWRPIMCLIRVVPEFIFRRA
jgi:decaprenylphospho-beta-D-erythro-pentofuranosid-2-ulose 2-reductase